MFYLFIFLPYLHVSSLTWWREKVSFKLQVLPRLLVVLYYYAYGFPLSWTANCFSAEPWINGLDKSFMSGWKLLFYDLVCQFCQILAFFVQKLPEIRRRNVPSLLKYKCHIRTQHTQIPLFLPIVLHYQWKKLFTPEYHRTHIVFVMWHESFELVFLGSLFHCYACFATRSIKSLPVNACLPMK